MLYKNRIKWFLGFIVLFLVVGFSIYRLPVTRAASQVISGYVWSETIGWIQMDGNWGGVSYDETTGNFTGYGWSENVGWINFNPIGPYPSSPSNSVKINTATGELSGWAQVESIKDCSGGWTGCGWISLRGTTSGGESFGVKFDILTKKIDGENKWAWSQDYGWMDFSRVIIGEAPPCVFVPSMVGYAWSENIGWIQLDGNWGGVTLDGSGNLSGYGWSENVGWVNFNPIGPYPSAPSYSAKYDSVTGEFSGWAQIESIKDCSGGWTGCGWISLKGTTSGGQVYGVKADNSTGDLSGFAWSQDYGWIDFQYVKKDTLSTCGDVGVGYNYIDNYKYSDGISVFTYADTGSGGSISGNAAITKGDTINYALEITNQGSVSKNLTNLKFTIPKGYIFDSTTAGVTCSSGLTPCGNPTPSGTVSGPAQITWSNITAPAGVSKITFKLKT